MTAAKNAKVGDLLRVPAHLLFPQRSGKWNRHDFSTAQVIRVGKGRSGGAMVMVRFYDEFRYTPGDPVRIECFYLDNCAKTDSTGRSTAGHAARTSRRNISTGKSQRAQWHMWTASFTPAPAPTPWPFSPPRSPRTPRRPAAHNIKQAYYTANPALRQGKPGFS